MKVMDLNLYDSDNRLSYMFSIFVPNFTLIRFFFFFFLIDEMLIRFYLLLHI